MPPTPPPWKLDIHDTTDQGAGHRDLHDARATRHLEALGLAHQQHPGALMEQAGLALARLALALSPDAREYIILAGPGNNGGDGLSAARHLHRQGRTVCVALVTNPCNQPTDAAHALDQARHAGVPLMTAEDFLAQPHPTEERTTPRLIIDALLGLTQSREPSPVMAALIRWANSQPTDYRLAADVPTGLHPDTGAQLGPTAFRAHATLTLLTLKPGLFTAMGQDLAGDVWWDPLDPLQNHTRATEAPLPTARLTNRSQAMKVWAPRLHQQHKGSFGDVWVLGGASGMEGAGRLAAQAALASGAGRVYLCPPGASVTPTVDTSQPELMGRVSADWQRTNILEAATVVCGCGGGETIADALREVLERSNRLVLDADALNAIAADSAHQDALAKRRQRGLLTILTPHPLEAARLAGTHTQEIQSSRLHWAATLARRYQAVVLLKGSGTVIADPDGNIQINTSGNARLATPGSGDVLAGWLGAGWSRISTNTPLCSGTQDAWIQAAQAAAATAWVHGAAAGPPGDPAILPLTASELIRSMTRVIGSLPPRRSHPH